MSSTDQILKKVDEYYSNKIQNYGATARGVDWNTKDSQFLRFEKLLQIVDHDLSFSILDFGCGYGALAEYLDATKKQFSYHGFDISKEMIKIANETHKLKTPGTFLSKATDLKVSDYVVASGIFNVKVGSSSDDWETYIRMTLSELNRLSSVGFAFNILTLYSDLEKRSESLYYADPSIWFDYCKRNFSKKVALLHDYPLYEFTILVRK